MTQVIARPNESFESMLRRFKRTVEREGVLADLRKHEYYEKPSVKRKRKSAAARKRAKKDIKFSKSRNINFRFNHDKTVRIPQPSPGSRPQSNNRPPPRRPYNTRPQRDR